MLLKKRKIKLLHLAQSAGYGVTIYVEALIKGLNSELFEQYLLGSEYYQTTRFENITSKLITIPMNRNISFQDIRTIRECRKIIRKENPDIVYCHSAKAGIYGRLACLGTKMKVVYNPHGWSFNMKCSIAKRIFYAFIEALFAIFTDRIVVISVYEKRSVPWYIQTSKIDVIVNGIDIDRCKLILKNNSLNRSKIGISNNAFVVGIIARISIQKGQDMLIEIAKKVKAKIPSAFFLIVGGESDTVNIEEKIKNQGLSDSFLITGEVVDAIRYASLFDVAVLTSRWEGFGLVLPEYMIAQKPIVAFGVDAIPDIIVNEQNGLLVRPGDLTEFANSIIRLYNDKILRSKLINNAMKQAESLYDMSRVCSEHEKLFVDLCEG